MASDADKRKLTDLRVVDLRAELDKRGLDKTGVKALLIERLQGVLKKEGHDPDSYYFEASDKRTPKRTSSSASKMDTENDTHSNTEDANDGQEVIDIDCEESDTKKEEVKEDPEENSETKEIPSNDVESERNGVPEEEDEEQKIDEDDCHILEVNPVKPLPPVLTIASPSPLVANKTSPDSSQKLPPQLNLDPVETVTESNDKQESNADNEDSINLTIGEDEEKLLIEEEDNSFQEKEVKDSSAVGSRRTQDSSSSGGKQGSSKDDSGETSKSAGQGSKGDFKDSASSQGERKRSSSPQQGSESAKDERRSTSKQENAEEAGSPSDMQQQQDSKPSSEKSRSGAVSKDHKTVSNKSDKDKKSRSPGSSSGRNLWVSGLSSSTRATDLKQTFSKFGKVIGAKVVTNARTPGARCYGFVTMATSDDASKCITHLDRTELHGRMISVERAKGDATGPPRKPPSPTSPSIQKDDDRKTSELKKGDGSKSGDESRGRSRERLAPTRPLRPRITAPSPEPRRRRSRSPIARPTSPGGSVVPPPARPPRVLPMSPVVDRRGGASGGVLTFAHIKEERERQRLRERDRELREEARRRREDIERQKQMERRQREEALRLEREREDLRLERERIERARKELIRLEREKTRSDREKLEWEREEIRRQQMSCYAAPIMDRSGKEAKRLLNHRIPTPLLKLRELSERAAPLPPPIPAVGSSRWSHGPPIPPALAAARYEEPPTRRTVSKRPNEHRDPYYEERKRPASGNDRRYEATQGVPPPPRFENGPSKRNSDVRRDAEFGHRNTNSSFERTVSATGGGVSISTGGGSNYERTNTSSRREPYFERRDAVAATSGAGRGGDGSRRDLDTSGSRSKEERYERNVHQRETFRGPRPVDRSSGDNNDPRTGTSGAGTGGGGNNAARRTSRERYAAEAGARGEGRYNDWSSEGRHSGSTGGKGFSSSQGMMSGGVSGGSSRDTWAVGNDRKNDGGTWGRSLDSSNSERFSSTRPTGSSGTLTLPVSRWSGGGGGLNVGTRGGGGALYSSTVTPMAAIGLGNLSGNGGSNSGPYSGADRFDAYKQPLGALRKY